MRIFVVGANPGPDTMERHVLSTLVEMGHEVKPYNARDIISSSLPGTKVLRALSARLLREPERLQERRICDEVAQFAPDLVLALLGSMLSPKTVAKLRKVTRARIVCWCQDQMTTLGRQYLLGAEYDLVFFKDRYLVELFQDMLGTPAFYLAEACNPDVHKPTPVTASELSVYGCDVCTYGNLYYYRQGLLESLREFKVKVWGNVPDWLVNRIPEMVMNRPVFEHEKSLALSAASITLNTLHFGEVRGLNVRAFEAAGCGAFQLISESDAVKEHFNVGVEVDTFRNRTELREKVMYYLANPEEVTRARLAARKRAHEQHTYKHRLAELLAKAEVAV